MAGIGEQLRAGREAGGLTIAEISRETGVPPHFLEALEREQFYELPDPVYVRGFIRTYSRFVGIEAATLIEQLPDELRFPGSAGAVIRMPPPEPKHAHQPAAQPAARPPAAQSVQQPAARTMPGAAASSGRRSTSTPATAGSSALASSAPEVVRETPTTVPSAPAVRQTPAAASAAPIVRETPAPAPPVPVVRETPAARIADSSPRPPVARPEDAPVVSKPAERVPAATSFAATTASANAASASIEPQQAPVVSERIIGAPETGVIIDGGVLEELPDPRARRGFAFPRMSLPLAGGAVALVLASIWLFSVIRGGGDGSVPTDRDGSSTDSNRGGAVEISAQNATKTATNAVATATRTATRTATSTPTSTPTPSPTPEPTATPVPPTATPTVYVPPPPPAVPVNAFALCQNLGGDSYDCGPDPVRVICAPDGGRFYDPNYTVLSPIPVEWAGWYERSVSGRLEGIQSAC